MITVDIILICYNQEKYIEQALRSIYAQKIYGEINVRILVADDFSTDRTLEIIKQTISESPFPIEILPTNKNLGISQNYKRSFRAVTADYVLILEGDDWWLSCNHVIQHVSYLNMHPECSMSANRYYQTTLDGTQQSLSKWHENAGEVLIDIEQQIINGNQLGNLSACCFRSQYLQQLPDDTFDMHVDDYLLGILMTRKGNIAILQEPTSVYRCNPNSMWASLPLIDRIKWNWRLSKIYDNYLQKQYHELWKTYRKNYICNIIKDARVNMQNKMKKIIKCCVFHS